MIGASTGIAPWRGHLVGDVGGGLDALSGQSLGQGLQRPVPA